MLRMIRDRPGHPWDAPLDHVWAGGLIVSGQEEEDGITDTIVVKGCNYDLEVWLKLWVGGMRDAEQ